MTTRIADIAAGKIVAAIEALQVPQVVKDSIDWDIIPAVGPRTFGFMLALAVPIPGTEDQTLICGPPVFDAFDEQPAFNELVRSRLHEVQAQADQLAVKAKAEQAMLNGGKTSSGGLLLP